MVEADVGVSHPISDIHDRKPDFLQESLEAAVLADSPMCLEEGANANVPKEAHRPLLPSEDEQNRGTSIDQTSKIWLEIWCPNWQIMKFRTTPENAYMQDESEGMP
ncbi:unnamed protein product [Sphagnum balticum]